MKVAPLRCIKVIPPLNEKQIKRFWNKVERKAPNECWPWIGTRHYKLRYGIYCYRRKGMSAHRFAYSLTVGQIPKDLLVLHHCDNPPCCNPAHLFIGTALDNIRDKTLKGRTPKGDNHWTKQRWNPLKVAE